jgi:glycerophosphoryl diester phosphodiesterase
VLGAAGVDAVRAAGQAAQGFLHNGVTAHRGNSGEFPENTLPAFASGIELGADWLELDIFRTKDGKLVVIHDRTTERVGDQNVNVAEATYEQLLTVDVATDFRRRTGSSLEQVPVERVPLLEDVLRLVKQQSRTRVSIQPKMDCVAEAVDMVKDLQAEAWVGFNDGNLQYMAAVKRLAPEIPVFWDRGASTDIADDISVAGQHGFESLVLHHSGVTVEKVQQINAAGLEVGAWTVNDGAVMEKLLGMGVERIYTDQPGTLLALNSQQQVDGRAAIQHVRCEGTYSHHLQGVCLDEESIYWSFTTQLVKTDFQGRVQKSVAVANHHGDLCYHEGQIYVAVNLGQFNNPEGHADSWVYVYNAETLAETARHEVQEVFHGAGGMGIQGQHFFVVGGLPNDVEQNYVNEYDHNFVFIKRHVIASGHTHLGIQTATFANGQWWFGCYGSPQILLVTDEQFSLQGRHKFDCSLGIVGLPDGQFLSATGRCESGKGCNGQLFRAVADKAAGLKIVGAAK